MFKRILFCIASVVLPTVYGQEAPKPVVIAADVHATPLDSKDTSSGSIRGTQLEMRGVIMITLLSRAYGVEADRIIGGPRRLEIDQYDIIAKVPPGTKNDAIPTILQSILAERFKLAVRKETRPIDGFALTPGKGKHKLKPAAADSESRCNTSRAADSRLHLKCTAYTMAMFSNTLRSVEGISVPLADQTGLQGNWDFEMDAPIPVRAASPESVAQLMEDVEDQLGLKLEQKRVDAPVIVIESMNAAPTPNAPGVAEMMEPPLPPMALEVATIKPTAPVAAQTGMRLVPQTGGMQLDAKGMKLSGLISTMSGLPADRVIVPPGADDQPFDIVAQFTGQMGPTLTGTVGPAIQTLLKERFKMESHMEDRPIDAYKLVAVKPKMAKADPENRAYCRPRTAPGAKDPREVTPGRTILWTCRNVTMDEFAERLQAFSGGFLRYPATNATKLEGMFDFTLNFTPQTPAPAIVSTGRGAVLVPGAQAAGAAGNAGGPGALDPSDNISFQEALSSQLGLKIEPEKRMMPVLVVDHLEKTPTEN